MLINVKTLSIYCLVCFVIGAGIGAWGEYTWGPRLTNTHTVEKPIIKENIITKTDTKIAYVPKEVIRYIDQETEQEISQPLDGKFTFNKPEFIYTVNGRLGKFTKTEDEKYIFDKNMMQLTQTSAIKIEAEIPTIDKTRHNSIGIGYGNHGVAGKLDFKNSWVYGDKDTAAVGIQLKF